MGFSMRAGGVVAYLALLVVTASAEFKPCERPFIFMNKAEIEGAKKRLKEPWAKRAMADSFRCGRRGDQDQVADAWYQPFAIGVLENEEVKNRAKAKLLGFIGEDVKKSKPRSNRTDYVILYDLLYDDLTPDQRKKIEDTFRKWIHYHLHDYWRGRETFKRDDGELWDTRYNRISWLPNMLHTRGLGIFMMALGMQDEKLIRECFNTQVAGFKWWMDHYVADQHFYMEEFNKQYSTFATLLLWCRGCKRLGLDELGFGYVGEGDGPGHSPGATMKKYCEGWIKLGFPPTPKTDGGMPGYPGVFMGDTGPCMIVAGYPDGATVMHNRYGTAHMNGPVPRPGREFWFEIAHAEWPDAGFDWLLAQMRLPKDDKYYPSLFFNIDPIDPKKVKPFPVKSYLAPERGFGMLRMEESGKYWSSPRPAAALQFGAKYVHYVHDCFTLLHYFAFEHPLYGRIRFGPHQGYAGGHPWQDSVRGHNGIVVDSMQIKPIDTGEDGAEHIEIRHRFSDTAKFLDIYGEPSMVKAQVGYTKEFRESLRALYPDTTIERALCLTDQYMFDVIRCDSDKERVYHWNHNPYGKPQHKSPKKWEPSADLNGGKLFSNMGGIWKKHRKSLEAGKFDLSDVMKREMKSSAWALDFSRGDQKPGVVIHMLGGTPTTVYYGVPGEGNRGRSTGITTTIAERRTDKTAFVVVHEPYLGEKREIDEIEQIQQTDDGVAVRIKGTKGSGVNDRILLAYTKSAEGPMTLADKDEEFTFHGFAHIRVADKQVLVTGNVTKMKLEDVGKVKEIVINGKPLEASVKRGGLTYEAQ